jgi:hypothetical protein
MSTVDHGLLCTNLFLRGGSYKSSISVRVRALCRWDAEALYLGMKAVINLHILMSFISVNSSLMYLGMKALIILHILMSFICVHRSPLSCRFCHLPYWGWASRAYLIQWRRGLPLRAWEK